MVFFVGAFIAQSTHCMQDEEQSLKPQQKKIKLDTQKILFARPAPVEDPDEVSYAYVHELTLDRNKNYYTDENEGKACILITSNDLHTLPFTKLLNMSEKELIEHDAAQNAIKEYESKMSILQQHPIKSALFFSTLSIATYATLNHLFKK
jgi:hypothetical protein